jgi:hypothetical protein
MPSFFRPSGGLLYHWRAWRSQRRWREFSVEIEAWLQAWIKPGGQLLLIGPSGGYTLSTEWLKGFAEIHAFDLDPLAPWFFRQRHPGVKVKFHLQDLFWQNGRLSPTPLRDQLKSFPNAKVLFCNVLGQLPLEGALNETDFAAYLNSLPRELKGIEWASYHDLFTIARLPKSKHQRFTESFRLKEDIQAAVGTLGPSDLEVIDHAIQGAWSRNLNRRIIGWSLTPKNLHLIEAIFVANPL